MKQAILIAFSFFIGITVVVAQKSVRRAVESSNEKQPRVALTFDADMTESMLGRLRSGEVSGWYNASVVTVLRKYRTSATFFITGLWAQTYPAETKSIADTPYFEIANHSYDHPSFTESCYSLRTATEEEKARQILETQEILRTLTGKTPAYFRFPGGCHTEHDILLVRSLGLIPVQWDVVSTDAFNPDARAITQRVLESVRDRSIVVMHLNGGKNAPETGTALETIIPELQNRNFKFVTVAELLGNN